MQELIETPHWKRVWQLVSGNVRNACPSKINELLLGLRDQLVEGLMEYSGKSTANIKKIKQQYKCTKAVDDFASKIANHLKIDVSIAWEILIYYVVFEFRGSLKSLQKLKDEINVAQMLEKVWRFYTMERMFRVKILKHIVEFSDPCLRHGYCLEYKNVINTIGVRNLWNSLFIQLEMLIKEIDSMKVDKDVPVKRWAERNIREQIEVLHCLILLCNQLTDCNMDDFKRMLKVAGIHKFGREPLHYASYTLIKHSYNVKLKYSEVGLLLCIANLLWSEISLVCNEDEELNEEIKNLKGIQEHGAVTYIWICMHMPLPNAEELYNNVYNTMMFRALQWEVFQFFADMVKHEMFDLSSLVGTCVRDALYNLMYITCNKFDADGIVYDQKGSVDIIHTLLQSKELCNRFLNEKNGGIISLWNSAKEMYPADYQGICGMAEAILLADPSLFSMVFAEMDEFPYFTIEYDENLISHTVRRPNTDSVNLLEEYKSPQYPKFTVPAGTECIFKKVKNKLYIQFNVPFKFWNGLDSIIQHSNTQLCEPDDLLIRLTPALRVALAVIKIQPELTTNNDDLANIMSHVLLLFNKYCCDVMCPNDFLCTCIDILAESLVMDRKATLKRISICEFLPSLTKYQFDYKVALTQNVINYGMVGRVIVTKERISEPNVVLLAYLNLIERFYKQTYEFDLLEYAAILFLLKEVFPNFTRKVSQDDKISREILSKSLNFLIEILQINPSETNNPICEHMLNTMCSLLLNESCGRSLLKLFCSRIKSYQSLVEEQTNWHSGCIHSGCRSNVMITIENMMRLLIRLLSLRKLLFTDSSVVFPLETYFFADGDKLHIVRTVAKLLDYPFDEHIPVQACTLLKIFTLEVKMPMLALLNLQSEQIRTIFLQKLRDPLEKEELKVTIIELIAAGIPRQWGMTEAFFRTRDFIPSRPLIPEPVSNCDTLGNFLVEYLKKISSNTSCLRNPLLAGITALFHTLWMDGKEMVVSKIIKDDQFWPSLCHPLFSRICLEDKTYTELFNIIAKELFKTQNCLDEKLIRVLKKFFSLEGKYVNNWVKHIFGVENEEDDYKLDIEKERKGNDTAMNVASAPLVMAWKDFLMITVKYVKGALIKYDVRVYIACSCRLALKEQIMQMKDACTLTFLAELYLFLLIKWDHQTYDNPALMYRDIIVIFNKVAKSYHHIPKRLQESMIAIVLTSLKMLPTTIANCTHITRLLVLSAEIIMEFEFNMFNNKELSSLKSENFKLQAHLSFTMMLSVINNLTNIQAEFKLEACKDWFEGRQIILLLYKYVGHFLKYKYTLPLAQRSIQTLICYASSIDSKDFLTFDMEQLLWKGFLPKKEFKFPKNLGTLRKIPEDLLQWWGIYRQIVVLLTILLRTHEHLFLKNAIMFVSVHEEYIVDILLLERVNVDDQVLHLVTMMLSFIYEACKYSNKWLEDHPRSLVNIMDAIKLTVSSSVGIILRPNILKFFTMNKYGEVKDVAENVPIDIVTNIMNRLMDIVYLAGLCILKFSPLMFASLFENIDDCRSGITIAMDFGVPKFTPENNELTFGTLLCLSCFLVRVLQQISSAQKSALGNADKDETIQEVNSETSVQGDMTQNKPTMQMLIARDKAQERRIYDALYKMQCEALFTKELVHQRKPSDSFHQGQENVAGYYGSESANQRQPHFPYSSSVSRLSSIVESGCDLWYPTEETLIEEFSMGSADIDRNIKDKSTVKSAEKLSCISLKTFDGPDEIRKNLAVYRLNIYNELELSITQDDDMQDNLSQDLKLSELPEMDTLQNFINEGNWGSNSQLLGFTKSIPREMNVDVSPQKTATSSPIAQKRRILNCEHVMGEAPSSSNTVFYPTLGIKSLSDESDSVHTTLELHSDESSSSLESSDSSTSLELVEGKKCAGIVRLDYMNPLNNLTAVQNFMSYATSLTIFPWFSKLNEKITAETLEVILAILSSQMRYILLHQNIEMRDRHLIRRELCSELQIFHEYVKKRLIENRKFKPPERHTLRRCRTGIDALQDEICVEGSDTDNEDDIRFFREENITEDDFLHFISNWFVYVLKTHDK